MNESIEFYRRSMRTSVWVSVLGWLFATVYGGFQIGAIYFLCASWMWLNLVFWGWNLGEVLGRRRSKVIFPLGLLKMLWLGGLFVVSWRFEIGKNAGHVTAFLLGLNTPFLIMSLKAVGRVVSGDATDVPNVRMDEEVFNGEPCERT